MGGSAPGKRLQFDKEEDTLPPVELQLRRTNEREGKRLSAAEGFTRTCARGEKSPWRLPGWLARYVSGMHAHPLFCFIPLAFNAFLPLSSSFPLPFSLSAPVRSVVPSLTRALPSERSNARTLFGRTSTISSRVWIARKKRKLSRIEGE